VLELLTSSDFGSYAISLRRLADCSFEANTFRDACSRLGTVDADSDESLTCYRIPAGGVLSVAIGDEAGFHIGAALVSVAVWPDCDPYDHADADSFAAARRRFDALYDDVLTASQAAIGAPLLCGRDQDAAGCRWAVWRGATGILAIQQSGYDVGHLGLDINYWIAPFAGDEIRPSAPFVDWLMKGPG
jgi:hypothetical protein